MPYTLEELSGSTEEMILPHHSPIANVVSIAAVIPIPGVWYFSQVRQYFIGGVQGSAEE
jgi:hypothetical protein